MKRYILAVLAFILFAAPALASDVVRLMEHIDEHGKRTVFVTTRKNQYPAAIDDGPGIKASKVLGLRFLTAVHFLLHLASEKMMDIELAREKLAKLIQYGRYNKRIIEDVMRRLAEGRK